MLKDLFKPSYEPYRRNPMAVAISSQQRKAISVGAILTESNCEFVDSLQPATPKEIKQRKQHQLLEDWWDITCPEEAVDGLDSLKNRGHRRVFGIVLANIPKALELEPTFDDYTRAFNEAGLPIAGEEITKGYPRELELTKKHIDIFHAISREETDDGVMTMIEEHSPLFGDEDTFDICTDIFWAMMDRYDQYAEFAYNLKETFEKLQKRGFAGDVTELTGINPAAWDMGRMVNVARWCYACGYIAEDVAWEYILWAHEESARHYENWTDFAKAYIVGRAIWGGDDDALDDMMDIADGLLKDRESPWRLVYLR